MPGLSIAISRDDRLAFARGYGLADVGAGEPVAAESRFRVASISKPITAVAVLRLVEQGRLSLADRVFGANGVIGTEYPLPPDQPWLAVLKVEHLLAHTSGGWTNDADDPMFLNREMSHAELIAWTLANQPLHHAPGANYAYSNFGYCLLGRIIEKLSARSYPEAVRETVLEPCGINDMAIAQRSRAERQPREVVYYGQDGDDPYDPPVARMDSHGGWIASATDLVRFAVRVNGFPGRPDILQPDTIRAMATGSAANPGYGLGWAVNDADSWWHGGSLPGTATILVRTAAGLCWAALANTRKPGLGGELDKMMWAAIGTVSEWPQEDLF